MTTWNRDKAVDALVSIGVRWDDAREYTRVIGDALAPLPVPPAIETDSVMDREDYWDFVKATPPAGMYGYERLDDDPRWFRVRVEAETPDQAEMRAVQVAKHLGTTEAISGGIVEPPSEGLWIVQIEGW